MQKPQVQYETTKDGKFIVHNYNWAKSFSNFFPGIAGKLGIPMWIYYVSRVQGICSMGIRDKDNPIMEFLSFNKAVQVVGAQGFRTFVKLGDGEIYEPFRKTQNSSVKQKMIVSSAELELQESNKDVGMQFDVTYFPIVKTNFAGFVRQLSIRNISESDLSFELIDGLPRILPAGINLHCVQVIPRHIEGMMKVDEVKGLPAYRLKQSPADIEQVAEIKECNYYISFSSEDYNPYHNSYIVDPYFVFAENENYDFPWYFKEHDMNSLLSQTQIRRNRTPSAFTIKSIHLQKGETISLYSVIGRADSDEKLLKIAKTVSKPDFLALKKKENIALIESIKDISFTVSADDIFDQYCEQTFLDNVIRGGMPVVFPTADGKTAFYVFSRQNGDLERDYHYFILEPAYYSQGNGHYRSVNQNRRSDVIFFPEVEDENIRTFINLIQTDGYNPLTVTIITYSVIKEKELNAWLESFIKDGTALNDIKQILSRPFTPGEFLLKLEEHGIEIRKNSEEILKKLLSFCTENENGDIHEGYWIDHWFYNLDLIDNYIAIYPDRLKALLIDNKRYYFYDDPDIIRPRDEKFVLVGDRVFQYNAVYRDEKKMEIIQARDKFPKRTRTKYGYGEVYYTNLLTKLLVLATTRLATLDPEGIGTEMESNKPGWNDSMNGLPGIIGSSLGETAELERLLRFLNNSLNKLNLLDSDSIIVFSELYEFMEKLNSALVKRLNSTDPNKEFIFWDESHTIKEQYREKTKYGISGENVEVPVKWLKDFIVNGLNLVSQIFSSENLHKITDKNGVPYTYFYHIVTEYEVLTDENNNTRLNEQGYPLVRPKKFKQIPIPLFLEGPMHLLKVHPELRDRIYNAVKNSKIFDKKLRMYKVCESLEDAPFEIGRVKAWGSGWIENESVYTHMEYKYLLEILRSGLYDQFFSDIKTTFMPFLKPEVYGRSIFENVSFIVSSAFPDEKMHGQGLQPRLSGVTGEMISMWLLMTVGKQPFFINEKGELNLRFEPVIADWLFTKEEKNVDYYDSEDNLQKLTIPKNAFAFKFLGKILVVYHNPKRKSTYGPDKANITRYTLHYTDGKIIDIESATVPAPYASDIREGKIDRIDCQLA